LFEDVELLARDEPHRLGAVALFKKGRKSAFKQPCSCFDGTLCRIYADRPIRCRTFECLTLKRVQKGNLATPEALRVIARVQRQAGLVRELIRRLGNTDEHVSLSRRYARLMAEPLDLMDHDNAELRARLMLEVAQLMKMLHQDFLAGS
jgi:Fe-S-cluster containining protein